jgi:hypothetical protein
LHRHIDVFLGEGLGTLAVGERLLQARRLGRRDALAQVAAVLPDLVLIVRPGRAAARSGTHFGAQRAVFHRIEFSQLPQDLGALRLEEFYLRHYV